MFITIKGVYNQGQIFLEETPPTTENVEVLIAFTEKRKSSIKKERQFGSGKGIVSYMSQDFNDPIDSLKDYM